MAVITPTESAVLLDDGSYEVECIRAEPEQLDNPQFGTGEVIRLYFEVIGETNNEGKPIVLDPIATAALTPQTKLWAWSIALGEQPVIGQEFDTDRLLHKHAMAQIKGKINPDGSKGYPKIENLIPLPKSAAKGKQPATKPAAKAPTTARIIAVVPEVPSAGAPGRLIALLKDYRSRMPEDEYFELREQLWILFPETDAFTPQGNRAFFPQRLVGENLLAAIDYLVTHPPSDVDEEGF